MPAKTKIVKKVHAVWLHRDKTGTAGSTTLTAAAAAGATTLTVSAITNFADTETIRVGAGEEMELAKISGAPAGSVITLASPLTYAHAVGEAVVEQTTYDVGDIEGGGVSVRHQGQSTDVAVATKRLAYTILNGFSDLSAEFRLPGLSLYSFAHATGMLLSAITGAGTVANPYNLTTDGNQFNGDTNLGLTAICELLDGTYVAIELWGVDIDYTGIDLQLVRGVLASIPVKAIASAGGLATTTLPTYVLDTTNRPDKGFVFDALSEVGIFVPETVTAGSSTVANTIAAAAQKVIEVAATTNFVAGEVVKVNTGDLAEYHEIDAILVTPARLQLRTPLFRSQAIGTAVVEYKRQIFGGISPDGVRLAVGGSVEPLRLGVRRMGIGIRPGAATITLSTSLVDQTLPNLAYALAIAQSQISGTRLPITSSNIGGSAIDGAYLKGILQNGRTAEARVWGCSQQITDFLSQWQQTGIPGLALTLRPGSGLMLLQYA